MNTFSRSVRVSVELLKALMYFVALLRAMPSLFAVSVLLKSSSTAKCSSWRILFAGKGL
jgi:hypothetical protein